MKQILASLLVGLGLMASYSLVATSPVGAINVFDDGCKNQTSKICADREGEKVDSAIQNLIGTLIFAIAAISVIMIIVGGIRYVVSNGDASKIKAAKDTIFYSVVGLVVALLAYAIVNFVIQQFT